MTRFRVILIAALIQVAAGFQAATNVHSRAAFFLRTSTVENTEGPTTASIEKKNTRVSVLLCPAQFCVPDDYTQLFEDLRQLRATSNDGSLPDIGTCRVAPLPRTEWIKVARQLPTRAFLEANLKAKTTLSWYFDAMEQALAEIFAEEGTDANVCIIGHSIGGWVARGYLAGLGGSSTAVFRLAQQQCSSLVTIGTPHISPEDALVDQTRGLIREIEENPAGSSQALAELGIDITCVCSSGLGGNFLTTNIEEIVAASSYLPLMGRIDGEMKGDGIVPVDLAFMEGARKIIVEQCSITGSPVRHSHVLPTPWNLWNGYAPSVKLPDDFVSYVSEGVLPQWEKYIR